MVEIAGYWSWFSAGLILMILEVFISGVFLLWIGFGAFFTGIISFLFPVLDIVALGFIFAVSSFISVLIGRALMKNKQDTASDLNNRAVSYIGKTYIVFEPITNGRGKVKVDDTLWQAEAEVDLPVGTSVKVVEVAGTILKVVPTEE